MGRFSLTAKAGIVLVVSPCLWLGTWALWHYSRSPVPLDEAIFEDGYRALLAVYTAVPVGLSLLIIAAIARRREKWDGFLRQWPLTQPGSLPGALRKLSPRRKPKQIAARAFSIAGPFNMNHPMLVLFLLLMFLWTIFVQMAPFMPHGFPIRAIRPGVKLVQSPGILPLRIHVVADYRSTHVQAGSEKFEPGELAEFLRREIPKRPPNWPVYVEGDPQLEYQRVAETIDAVSAFRVQVVLLTPSAKSELGEPDTRQTAKARKSGEGR